MPTMARSPSRRDDDRYVRDRRDDRGHRRRSRSRDRDRRHEDRNRLTPPRFHDRHDDHRGSRRERSRDRKRSREASPVRDRHDYRDRYRDERDRYDERDRKRSRRDDEPPRGSRREDSRERRGAKPSSGKDHESSRPSTADAEEEAKKAKLAKVEAWKKKIAEKKRNEATASAPDSPQVATSHVSPEVGSPTTPVTGPGSPAPSKNGGSTLMGPGKAFDPKEISRRAAEKLAKNKTLGGDVVIHKSASDAPNMNGSKLADNSKVAPSSLHQVKAVPSNAGAKITGFGLNKAASEKQEKPMNVKSTAPLGEEEEVSRKLEKLPDIPMQNDSKDAALANGVDDQDDGNDIRSDEEEAEAARVAAQKRAEEMRADQSDVTMAVVDDTGSGSIHSGLLAPSKDVQMVDDDDVDPLDAFMNGLQPAPTSDFTNLAIGRNKKKEPQVFNSDDEEADLDAIGDNGDDLLNLAKKSKKKDMPKVDHSKMKYDPFRKDFYSESVELAEMTPEDVDILRADLDNITIKGTNAPKPIVKWSQAGFGAQILDVIREQKFEKPTSIQSQALPAIMSGRDIMGVAKTGSGKTLAFILPMFRHIKDQRPLETMDGPIGLIITPTRELAVQIHRECKPYLKALDLRAVCAYGGSPIKDQIAELKRGVEIIVCTPGRLIELLTANAGRVTNLRRVTYLVLDEADRMFDMGFEPQITKIMSNVRPERQTVLFSATFAKSMESLAKGKLTKPLTILVGGRSVVAPEITQIIEVRKEETKFRRLLELLGDLYDTDEDARTLIFVERQETADNILKDLMRKSYPCITIHGGREQLDRDQAISDFKAGIFPIMIATSVAARGLDVKQLKLVVNFDSPNHLEDYVHRAGRTGRAGNTGTAVTFVTPEQDRFAPFLVKALTDSQQEVPEALKELVQRHEEKVKAGEAKKAGSGFGGKGIERLDAARDAERAAQRKQYKTGDEPDDDEEETEKKDAKQTEVDKLLAKATGNVQDRGVLAAQSATAAGDLPAALAGHLANAMKSVQKAEVPVSSAPQTKSSDPLAQVSAAAASINNRLGARGTLRSGTAIDNRGPDAGAFHATLEINDFPQKARWGVTNRTNVAKILDSTGTSITTKGEFYAPPKQPAVGDKPKLYILVEGHTEPAVSTAMQELTRLLKEGTIAYMTAEANKPAGGRYNVV